jgi:hypothetical protein
VTAGGERPHRPTLDVAGPEHEVAAAGEDRLQESGVVADPVLEVAVLDEHDLARRVAEALPDRVALAARLALQHEGDARVLGVGLHHVAGAVVRVALDDHHLEIDAGERCVEYRVEHLRDGAALVVHGQDDTQGRACGG